MSKLKFNPELNVGQIVQALTFLVASGVYWAKVDMRIARLEEKQIEMHSTVNDVVRSQNTVAENQAVLSARFEEYRAKASVKQ